MIGEIGNHIWQSTTFALLAALVTLMFRNNRAHVRYLLWFSASAKFLLPFSLLIGLGSLLQPPQASKLPPNLIAPAATMVQVSAPFASNSPILTTPNRDWLAIAILAIWVCGFAAIVLMRLRDWRRIRAAVRASTPVKIPAPIEIRAASGLLEPGVVGIFRPNLLIPAGILERLSADQFKAVLAHELRHVRRRDNLTSAIHMMVEAIFWFHPLVWWIGSRLVDERERACDEEVLRQGSAPGVYAECIVQVCKNYVESPLTCAAGVMGSDLKKRIQMILAGRIAPELNFAKRIALGTLAILAIAGPIAIGLMKTTSIRAQSKPSEAPILTAQAKSAAPVKSGAPAPARPSTTPAYISAIGNVIATTVSIKPRVDGQLKSVDFKEGDMVQAGQLLATIDPRPFELNVMASQAQLMQDREQLAQAQKSAGTQNSADVARLQQVMVADEANLQRAQTQLQYTQIRSPMAGMAGLCQVDPGNIVYSAADAPAIVTITQLQPIAVVFTISEQYVPKVHALINSGASTTVEAWNQESARRIATGRLTAIDNHIDTSTGTLKLKAEFDNKDGALFPNQFVNVRLLLNK
jgi:RND family efflux transporter MFP subunit